MEKTNTIIYSLCIIFIMLFFSLFSNAEKSSGSDASKNKPTIYVVNYPLKYFAERIGGEMVDVKFPAPPDVDPVYWMPDADIIRAYQKADLILLNGVGYAKWVRKATLPKSKLVDTSSGFKDQYIYIEEAVTHSHGPGGEHAHTGAAFTTWLNPELAIKQAKAILESLIKLLPEQKIRLENNFESLKSNLIALDDGIQKIVSIDPNKPLIGSHPVYQYLARRYGLNLKSVHWEPDEMPGLDQWQELQNLLETHPAKWMIWEDTPINETKNKLESLGVNSIVFNPCGNTPDTVDYMSVMRQNVENLKMAFRVGG